MSNPCELLPKKFAPLIKLIPMKQFEVYAFNSPHALAHFQEGVSIESASEEELTEQSAEEVEEEGNILLTDAEIKKMAEEFKSLQLPGNERTRQIYRTNWANFCNFCREKKLPDPKVVEPSEDVWIVYFGHMINEKKYKSAWSLYSSLSARFLVDWGYVYHQDQLTLARVLRNGELDCKLSSSILRYTLKTRCPRLIPTIEGLLKQANFEKKKVLIFSLLHSYLC